MAETNTTNVAVVLQVPTSVKALIEALIFGAREPLSVRQLQVLYEDQGTNGGEPRKIDYEEINRSVEELNGEYAAADRPYRIIQIAGGFQFATLPIYAEWLGRLYKEQTRRKLSQSSIETLAIIAYKQPITKPEIESIRGVNCDYVLSTLLEKDLATIVGRAPTVGRPLLYGTSREFLRHFGLNDLNDLPRPREIQEILGDSQFETERRMLEAQQGLDEKKEEDFKSRLPHIPKRKPGLDDEVKILPKKRVRDIKVVPAEEAGNTESGVTPAGKPADKIAAEPVENNAEQPILGVETSAQQEIPIVESETPAVTEQASALTSEPPEVDTTDTLKIFVQPLPEPMSSKEEAHDEPVTAEPGLGLPSEAASLVSDELLPDLRIEESAPRVQESEFTPSIQVEEEAASSNLVTHLQISEEPIVQEVNVASPAVQETVIPGIPQTMAPTTEDRGESIPAPELQEHADLVQSDSDAPHPKTRWKSWKEKIQGFIKKLFG